MHSCERLRSGLSNYQILYRKHPRMSSLESEVLSTRSESRRLLNVAWTDPVPHTRIRASPWYRLSASHGFPVASLQNLHVEVDDFVA